MNISIVPCLLAPHNIKLDRSALKKALESTWSVSSLLTHWRNMEIGPSGPTKLLLLDGKLFGIISVILLKNHSNSLESQ